MAKKICPGIIVPGGYPMMVSVVKKSVRMSAVNPELIEMEYLDGWRKNFNVTKGAKKISIYKNTTFLYPHGNMNGLAFPETIEAVLQVTDKIFPGIYAEREALKEQVQKREKEIKELKDKMREFITTLKKQEGVSPILLAHSEIESLVK